jgi:hypothetical protein
MLQDWPIQKAELLKFTLRAVQHRRNFGAPLSAQIPHITLNEGEKVVWVYPDGERRELELESHQFKWTIDRQQIASGEADVVPKAVESLGHEMAREMETSLLKVMESASSRAGSMFSGQTKEELEKEIFAALEAMDVTFDEDGKPNVFFTASPDAARRMAALNTPEGQERFDAAMEIKRREWLRRESYRRLVD